MDWSFARNGTNAANKDLNMFTMLSMQARQQQQQSYPLAILSGTHAKGRGASTAAGRAFPQLMIKPKQEDVSGLNMQAVSPVTVMPPPLKTRRLSVKQRPASVPTLTVECGPGPKDLEGGAFGFFEPNNLEDRKVSTSHMTELRRRQLTQASYAELEQLIPRHMYDKPSRVNLLSASINYINELQKNISMLKGLLDPEEPK